MGCSVSDVTDGAKLAKIGHKLDTLRTFSDQFQYILVRRAKFTETGIKKSQICPIWGQSDPIWMHNLTIPDPGVSTLYNTRVYTPVAHVYRCT